MQWSPAFAGSQSRQWLPYMVSQHWSTMHGQMISVCGSAILVDKTVIDISLDTGTTNTLALELKAC